MRSVSRLYAVLETVLSNSSVVDNVVGILSDVGSLSGVVDSVRAVSDSCKFTLCNLRSGFDTDTLAVMIYRLLCVCGAPVSSTVDRVTVRCSLQSIVFTGS